MIGEPLKQYDDHHSTIWSYREHVFIFVAMKLSIEFLIGKWSCDNMITDQCSNQVDLLKVPNTNIGQW